MSSLKAEKAMRRKNRNMKKLNNDLFGKIAAELETRKDRSAWV